ncbi:MAG: hypothetical protein ACKV2T_23490 [Kofleriaceae bacterium]
MTKRVIVRQLAMAAFYSRVSRARVRGCDHVHALRIVARAWCRVLWTCWQKREPYDPTKHRAARDHTLRLVEQEAA